MHIVQKLNRSFKKSCPNYGLFIQFGQQELINYYQWAQNSLSKDQITSKNQLQCSIFVYIFCLGLAETPELLCSGEIRLATASQSSIGTCRNGQDQWCVHSCPFQAFRTNQKLTIFAVIQVLCLLSHFITSLVAERLQAPNQSLREQVLGSKPARSNI